MSDDRRPSAAFWITILVVASPFLYLLGFGPACWLVNRNVLPARATAAVYCPLVRAANSKVRQVSVPLRWYADLNAPERREWSTGRGTGVVDLMEVVLTLYDDEKAGP
jgi:hypothetical protein